MPGVTLERLCQMTDEEYVAYVDEFIANDSDGDEIDDEKMLVRMDI